MEVWLYMKNQSIINHMDYILKYTNNLVHADSKNNGMITGSCVFNLYQIDGSIYKLYKKYLETHQGRGVSCFKMDGLRNCVVHDYESAYLIQDEVKGAVVETD